MLKRIVFPVVVAACAGLALAQSNSQPAKKTPTPTKAPAPKKQPSNAPAPTLKAGDKAPAISVESWVKGSPVKSFESGKVYVVEFWATWCGPCQKSIPHLTELQQKHKELTVIGVASSEKTTASGPDRRLENLENWVKAKGRAMEYTVAYDGPRRMSHAWMDAAGQGFIPCAFIVGGDGKLSWIGNPLGSDFSEQVEKALKAAAPKQKKEETGNNGNNSNPTGTTPAQTKKPKPYQKK